MTPLTAYAVKNKSITGITGMSDDDFYGRQPALGVDIDACYLAAGREARRGMDAVLNGCPREGALKIRRAVYRLAIAVGNQTVAERYLYEADMPRPRGLGSDPAEKSDREQLDRAAARRHAHPDLLAALREIEAELAALK